MPAADCALPSPGSRWTRACCSSATAAAATTESNGGGGRGKSPRARAQSVAGWFPPAESGAVFCGATTTNFFFVDVFNVFAVDVYTNNDHHGNSGVFTGGGGVPGFKPPQETKIYFGLLVDFCGKVVLSGMRGSEIRLVVIMWEF